MSSKKARRKKEFLKREKKRDIKKKYMKALSESKSMEDMAKLMGIRLN